MAGNKFTYLVHVETEKTAGLMASRDEQSEKIVDELDNLAGNVDLSGLGARSDSEYGIVNIDVWEMSKRDEKEMHAEYEQAVREAAPDDRTLRNEIASAKAEAEKYKSLYETQKSIVDQIVAGDPLEGSPVYQDPRGWRDDESPRLNIDPREYIYVQFGEHHNERFSIRFRDGELEVSADTIGRDFVISPRSGNVVAIKVIDR